MDKRTFAQGYLSQCWCNSRRLGATANLATGDQWDQRWSIHRMMIPAVVKKELTVHSNVWLEPRRTEASCRTGAQRATTCIYRGIYINEEHRPALERDLEPGSWGCLWDRSWEGHQWRRDGFSFSWISHEFRGASSLVQQARVSPHL